MAILIVLLVVVMPAALLFALPIWASIHLSRRGKPLPLCLLPLLVPAATAASEVYAMRLVGKIAQEPIGGSTEIVRGAYPANGYAAEAVRAVVRFPSLSFAEGLLKENDRWGYGSIFQFDRMPDGIVRFSGRRVVTAANDCSDSEVSVPITARRYPHGTTWYCTTWTPVRASGATHEIRRTDREYQIGPFLIFEKRDFAIRRSDRKAVNTLITASTTGGLWWHLMEWLGDTTGVSSLGAGNMVGRYQASTADYLDETTAEAYLMTGGG